MTTRWLLLAVLLSACNSEPEIQIPEVHPEFGTNAPDCWKFYNKPGLHRQWADCIGVGYVSD